MTDAKRTLSQMERDVIATYVVSEDDQLPWWQWVAIPVAGGIAMASMDIPIRWLGVIVAIAAAGLIGAVAGLAIKRAGTVPRFRAMPAPLRRVMIVYWAVAGVGLAAILAWAFTTDVELSFVWGGAVYVVFVIVIGTLSDMAYRRAVERLAVEAGIVDG